MPSKYEALSKLSEGLELAADAVAELAAMEADVEPQPEEPKEPEQPEEPQEPSEPEEPTEPEEPQEPTEPTEPQPDPDEPQVPIPDQPKPIPPILQTLPLLRDRIFDHAPTSAELRGIGWDDRDVVVKDPDLSYVPDPLDPSRTVLRVHTPIMPKGGTATIPNIQTLHLPPLTEIYAEIETMVDSDFEGEKTGENKRLWVGVDTQGNNIFLTYRCRGTGPIIPGIKLQGSCDPRGETSPEGLVRSPFPVLRNKWYRYGIYAKAGIPTAFGLKSNGILALVIDGQEVARINDVNFSRKASPKDPADFGHVQFSNTYGGGNAPTKAFNDYVRRILVRGR